MLFRLHKVILAFCSFLTLVLAPGILYAIPISFPFHLLWTSEDSSKISITGPAVIPLEIITGSGRSNKDIIIGPGGSLTLTDKKNKNGDLEITGIVGSSFATYSGNILGGGGTIELAAVGIPELFQSSIINLTFISGTLSTGITFPGDQLSGPEGSNTFIEYTSHWFSLDPVGETSSGQPIVLGDFWLNSTGRPSDFTYSFDQTLGVGSSTFTIGESFIPDTSYIFDGTVTKNMNLHAVPEPCNLAFLSVGIAVLYLQRFRKTLRQGKNI